MRISKGAAARAARLAVYYERLPSRITPLGKKLYKRRPIGRAAPDVVTKAMRADARRAQWLLHEALAANAKQEETA